MLFFAGGCLFGLFRMDLACVDFASLLVGCVDGGHKDFGWIGQLIAGMLMQVLQPTAGQLAC